MDVKIDNTDENLSNREKISAKKLTFWYLKMITVNEKNLIEQEQKTMKTLPKL